MVPERQLEASTVLEESAEAITSDASEEILSKFTSLPPAPSAPTHDRSDCEWPNDWGRAPAKVVVWQLLRGRKIPASRIARWSVLNPRDIALCKSDREEFTSLTEFVRERVRRVAVVWDDVQFEERIQAVQKGRVAPYESRDPKDLERAVTAMVAGMKRKGVALSRESAKAQLAGSVPPPMGKSYLSIEGKYYLHEDFEDLPDSQRQFDQIKFLVTQELMGYALWLEGRGIEVDRRRLDQVFVRISSMKMADLGSL